MEADMEEVIEVAADRASRHALPDAAATVLDVTRRSWFAPPESPVGPRRRPPEPARAPLKRSYLRLLSLEC